MIQIFCDGSCRGNGEVENLGGCGYVVVKDNQPIYTHTEAVQNTTNNRMELLGLIRALKYLKDNNIPTLTSIFCDSMYVVKGSTQWSKKWKENNWKRGKKSKEEVKNVDLWKKIDYLLSVTNPNIQWIKGHQNIGNFNDYIDKKIGEDLDFN